MTGLDRAETVALRRDTARAGSWLSKAAGGKFGYLLGSLVALLLSAPLIVSGWGWNAVIGLCAGAVLVAGLQAARPGRRSLAIGLVLAGADFAIGRLVFLEGARWLVAVQAALWLSTLLYVTLAILDAVFERKGVGVETLQAAFCVYLLLGLIWVYLYMLMEVAAPGSFLFGGAPQAAWGDDPTRRAGFLRVIVFSYSVLTGSGIRDLEPAGGFASICASLESLSSQVYLAVVVARLVGMEMRAEDEPPPSGRPEEAPVL